VVVRRIAKAVGRGGCANCAYLRAEIGGSTFTSIACSRSNISCSIRYTSRYNIINYLGSASPALAGHRARGAGLVAETTVARDVPVRTNLNAIAVGVRRALATARRANRIGLIAVAVQADGRRLRIRWRATVGWRRSKVSARAREREREHKPASERETQREIERERERDLAQAPRDSVAGKRGAMRTREINVHTRTAPRCAQPPVAAAHVGHVRPLWKFTTPAV
jgi:hypothetical protein